MLLGTARSACHDRSDRQPSHRNGSKLPCASPQENGRDRPAPCVEAWFVSGDRLPLPPESSHSVGSVFSPRRSTAIPHPRPQDPGRRASLGWSTFWPRRCIPAGATQRAPPAHRATPTPDVGRREETAPAANRYGPDGPRQDIRSHPKKTAPKSGRLARIWTTCTRLTSFSA